MHFHVFTIPEFIACLAVPFSLGWVACLGAGRLTRYFRNRRMMRIAERELDEALKHLHL